MKWSAGNYVKQKLGPKNSINRDLTIKERPSAVSAVFPYLWDRRASRPPGPIRSQQSQGTLQLSAGATRLCVQVIRVNQGSDQQPGYEGIGKVQEYSVHAVGPLCLDGSAVPRELTGGSIAEFHIVNNELFADIF